MGTAKTKFTSEDPKQVISAKVKGESNILFTDQAKQALYYNSKIVLYSFAQDLNVRLAIGRILNEKQIQDIRDWMFELFNVRVMAKDAEKIRNLIKMEWKGTPDKKTIDKKLQHVKDVQKGTGRYIDKVNASFANMWLKVALKGDGPFYPPTVPLETNHIDPSFLESMGEAYQSLRGIRKFVRQPGKEDYSKTGFQPIMDDNIYEDIGKRIIEIDNKIYEFGYYETKKLSFRDAQRTIADICHSTSELLGNIMFFVDSVRQKDITFKTGRVEEIDPFTKNPLTRYSFLQTNRDLMAPNMSALRGYVDAMQRSIDSDQADRYEQIKATNAKTEGENDAQYNDRIIGIEKDQIRSEKKQKFENLVKSTPRRDNEKNEDYLNRLRKSVDASFSDNIKKLIGFCDDVFKSYDLLNQNATEGKEDDVSSIEEFNNKIEQAKVFSEQSMQGSLETDSSRIQRKIFLQKQYLHKNDEAIESQWKVEENKKENDQTKIKNKKILQEKFLREHDSEIESKLQVETQKNKQIYDTAKKIREALITLNIAAESILKKYYPYIYKIKQSVAADKKSKAKDKDGNPIYKATKGYRRQMFKTADSNAVTAVFEVEDEIKNICKLAEIREPASLKEIGAWRRNPFYETGTKGKSDTAQLDASKM
jgi:hypothetical protein